MVGWRGWPDPVDPKRWRYRRHRWHRLEPFAVINTIRQTYATKTSCALVRVDFSRVWLRFVHMCAYVHLRLIPSPSIGPLDIWTFIVDVEHLAPNVPRSVAFYARINNVLTFKRKFNKLSPEIVWLRPFTGYFQRMFSGQLRVPIRFRCNLNPPNLCKWKRLRITSFNLLFLRRQWQENLSSHSYNPFRPALLI